MDVDRNAKLIATSIKNHRRLSAREANRIGVRKIAPHIRDALPVRPLGDFEPIPQRRFGLEPLNLKLSQCPRADDPHVLTMGTPLAVSRRK